MSLKMSIKVEIENEIFTISSDFCFIGLGTDLIHCWWDEYFDGVYEKKEDGV
jgi:hypothetical protein